jgi:myosin-1
VDWKETINAMGVIGISVEDQDEILRNLATVLWLGNVQFSEGEDGNSVIADESVPAFVAYLMEVEPALVSKVLTSRVVETSRGGKRGTLCEKLIRRMLTLSYVSGSVYEVPLNPAQASSVRDALAKAIYNNLFDWIVARVNVSMKAQAATAHIIGVLDIYGFEIFDVRFSLDSIQRSS